MIKLMIVEDEWLVREGLKLTIAWHELQCEVVAEADSGITALPLIESVRPDIILTDIRMPGMDGLEMAQRARQLLPGVEIVFLTGFDDFSYAQRALKMGSVDYVLKPTNPVELMQVIRSVADKVRNQQVNKQVDHLLQMTRFKNSSTLLANKLLYDLLMDSAGEKERELYLELRGSQPSELGSYRVALMEIERRDLPHDQMKKLLLMIEEQFYDTDTSFTRVYDKFAILLSEEENGEQWLKLADNLANLLGDRILITGWSQLHHSLMELSSAYDEAEHALEVQAGVAPEAANTASRWTELPSLESMRLELRQTIAYIDSHYQEEISLQEIASSLHMSESSFCRLFKKGTGVSFVEYVTQQRMNKAKELLRQPDEKIYEISLAVGYKDSRYFSQVFRKYTGDTPSEFRSKIGYS